MLYKIVRMYEDRWFATHTIKTGLTLAEAQEHCGDPETSSRTCSKTVNLKRTTAKGRWFDGYTECKR